MRVEGGYTFAARIERVYDALTTDEGLERTLPGCERLIQLGPTRDGGTATFEARLRRDGDVMTVRLSYGAARRPAHARFDIAIFSPAGSLRGRGLFDLVDQEAHTVGAYVLDLTAADPGSATAPAPEEAQAFIQDLCDGLSRRLREEVLAAEATALDGGTAVRTPRGRIVALRPVKVGEPAGVDYWAQRAAWMAGGLVLGMGTLALMASVARWLTDRDDA